MAGGLYHDAGQWVFSAIPKVERIRHLFVFEDKSEPLTIEQFKEFHEKYIYPLFCYFYGNRGSLKEEIGGDDDKMFGHKEDFLNMIWILDNCLNKPGLRAGIRLVTR